VVKYHLRRGVGFMKFLENGTRPQPPTSPVDTNVSWRLGIHVSDKTHLDNSREVSPINEFCLTHVLTHSCPNSRRLGIHVSDKSHLDNSREVSPINEFSSVLDTFVSKLKNTRNPCVRQDSFIHEISREFYGWTTLNSHTHTHTHTHTRTYLYVSCPTDKWVMSRRWVHTATHCNTLQHVMHLKIEQLYT